MPELSVANLHLDPALPITAWSEEIVDAIKHHQVVVVAGETGSGKTTQLPKLCLLAGRERIAHTQPRRLAARTVAERIAQEMEVELGELVGYQVRFTRKAGKATRIKLMTDGVLLNEVSFDRDLRRYDTIIIDEAHERSLNIDFLLGYLKQLLPRRPGLKVIVTSATIDTARFSEHFDDAPVIEVSGRTFPVEIRYRPLHDDGALADGEAGSVVEKDQLEGIADAVAELSREGDGDILVFLSGEREIRDTADHLNSLELRHTEIVPLYARLSATEQHRVFSPHAGRRVVLATNVAETSLTVPGIRYVVDAGTARISRYSARTKVQRLPIEPISQASANQRSGRCGRVAPGVAIRLYSEADFESRPAFTEPEILRTNLAAVILQMADARLGSIVDFPFVEAPDSAQINDGLRLLDELGALASGKSHEPRLTAVGKQLAKIPVDPRLGRMLVAGAEHGCLRDVMIIVSGLSIQDPRERPSEHHEQADAMHRRFWTDAILTGEDEGPGTPKPVDASDFLVMLRLWRYVRRQQKALSGNAFRRMCREEYLNYLRLREWADLHAQLRDVAIDLGLTHQHERRGKDAARETPEPHVTDADAIHTALLTGLLSHVGLADIRRVDPNLPARKRVRLGPQEYLGARGAKFAVQRGSSLAKTPPNLVMAFELVETTRLWARTVAAIEPEQVERAGAHLVKKQYSEPYWSSRQGAVMAYEKVTLLGVPIVAQRPVHYARINPEVSREIFIQKALVEGDWHTRHHFFARNQEVREQAAEMEERTRRRDILISDAELAAFYAARIPADVVSQTHFDTWWRQQRRVDEHVLDLTVEDLISDDAQEFDEGAFPDDWVVEGTSGTLALPISYTFDPGSGKDGVLVTVPLAQLNQLQPDGFTWQIPGHRRELATELIRSLPKQIRTSFVPAPNFGDRALAWLEEHPERHDVRFVDALAEALRQLTGIVVPPDAWHPESLPSHLRVTFEVVEGGKVTATGEDLGALQEQLARQLSSRLTTVARQHAKTGATDWDFGTIPATTELSRNGTTLVGYPALVDETRSVGLAVLDTPLRQSASHRAGLRRLVMLRIPDPTKWVVAHLGMSQKLALATSPYASVPELVADARLASVGELIAREGEAGQVRDEAAFRALCDRVRADHADHVREVVDVAARTLERQSELAPLLAALPAGDARSDLEEQLKNLVFPGFIAATPEPHYHQLPRYLHAMVTRIAGLRSAPKRDEQALDVVWELEDAYATLCAAQPAGPLAPDVADIGWALEELRVSLFAQSLGTRVPVSAKRVRTMIKNAS